MMSDPVVSRKTYFIVFVILLILLAATLGVAYLDLGPLNEVVALTIAIAKALLIILYFMHVRYSGRVTWVFVGLGFFWLAILVTLTMSDYLTRNWLLTLSG